MDIDRIINDDDRSAVSKPPVMGAAPSLHARWYAATYER